MNKSKNLYNLLGVSPTTSMEQLERKMQQFEAFYQRQKDNGRMTELSEQRMEETEREYKLLCENRTEYDMNITRIGYSDSDLIDMVNNHSKEIRKKERDAYLDQLAVDNDYEVIKEKPVKPKYKMAKTRKKIISMGLALVLIMTTGGVTVYAIKNRNKNIDPLQNVCVEYTIKDGDTKTFLNDTFDDYNYSYHEVSGPYRSLDDSVIYAGDVVIGITTKEKADELVANGKARIISVEEAIDLLKDNSSLAGEFKRYAEGKSNVTFYVPVDVKTI